MKKNNEMNRDYSSYVIHKKIEDGILKKVKDNKMNAYYSLSNKDRKNKKNENVIIFLSDAEDIEKNHIRYSKEYHTAGYDFYIVDISSNKNAGSDLFDYLWLNYRGRLPQNIFIHGNNEQREDALLLCKNRQAKNDEIKGVILSSYRKKNDFVTPNNLNINTNIYLSYDHTSDDYHNNTLYNELLHKGVKVKKFSFTDREQYQSFSELNKTENNKILKSLGYNNKEHNKNEIKIGMPIKDQMVFSQIAEKKGIIIGVRPIDANSTSLITSGEYSSKSLTIKAKSSDWGPMAGFIPVDQSLAKASAQQNLPKYSKAINEALDSGAATVSELYISAQRVDELINNKTIQVSHEINESLKVEIVKNNKKHTFYLVPEKNNAGLNAQENNTKPRYLVQQETEQGIKSLLVISDPISRKPMIADYDLFTIIYPYSHLGSDTRTTMPVSWEEWKSSVDFNELTDEQKILYQNKTLYDKNEGPQLGYISNQVKELKNELNKELGRTIGMEIVHHGADDANPFAVIQDNFPATFFVPKSLFDKPLDLKNQTINDLFNINENGTVIIQSPEEFSKLQQLLIDIGYIAPINEQWNKGTDDIAFTRKRKISSVFIETKNEIKRKLSIDNKDNYTLKYEHALKQLENNLYIENRAVLNLLGINNSEAKNEIELLLSDYNRKNDLVNMMESKNKQLSKNDRKVLYSKMETIEWFKKTGYNLLKTLMHDEDIFLNKANEAKLLDFFSLQSKYSDINTSIYKSIYVKDNHVFENNIKKGNLLAFDGVFHGFSNIEKVKKASLDNVYIAIIGKHGAKPLTSLSSGSTEQAIIAPGTHFRIIENKTVNNKKYLVLEVAHDIAYKEPVFDLYDGKLKGIGIENNRTTFSEKLDKKINSSRLKSIFESWRGESIDTISIKSITDKIIEGKLSIDYAVHKYFNEISKLFSTENSNILSKRLYHCIYDPFISKKFNQYVNGTITLDTWMDSYSESYLNSSLTENAKRVKILLESIYDLPSKIDKLSQPSIELLSAFFNTVDIDQLSIKLFRIALNKEEYKKSINEIDDLIILDSNKNNFSSIPLENTLELSKNFINKNNIIKQKIFNLRTSLIKNGSSNRYGFSLGLNPYDISLNNENDYGFLFLKLYIERNYDSETVNKIFNLLEDTPVDLNSGEETSDKLKFIDLLYKTKENISGQYSIDNDFNYLGENTLLDFLTKAKEGSYLLEVDDYKISVNKKTDNNKNITYDMYIPEVGMIKTSGKNNNKITADLLSFISEVTNVKFNQNKSIYNISGTVYQLASSTVNRNNEIDNLINLGISINDSISKVNKIRINGIELDKRLLVNLGARIDNQKIESMDILKFSHNYSNLTFDSEKLNDYFLTSSGTADDEKVISVIKELLNNRQENIKKILSVNGERIEYIASCERLAKIIELKNSPLNGNYWDSIRKPSLKIPRHMKILSKVGYGNIGYSVWQSVNNTFSSAAQLNNPSLSIYEKKEIITDLSLMWSEMGYNGVSEVIEILLAKGMLKYRHNPLKYINKMSSQIGIALNVLSIGFDIYSAYSNFSKIAGENDEKRKIDYIVNGSFAIVSGLVTLGVSIGMLAGSVAAGPIGITVGVLITLATSIYHAARIIEEAKNKVQFTGIEEFNNGFYAFLMGDILPNKKNEITYLETENQLEEVIDKNAVGYFGEIKKQNENSRYFYVNEKYHYQEHYYYKVISVVIDRTVDSILNPIGEFIQQRVSQNMSKDEAEKIAAMSSLLKIEKTEYKYFLPSEAIATNDKIIFDIDFYINELNRYTKEIISDSYSLNENEDEEFLNNIKTTKQSVINELGISHLENNLIKIKNNSYYASGWHENERFYFNTFHGEDIIAAPVETYNTFDIYNGTKRLSGGNKDDFFNVHASESPKYASRFYGREGNDTLRLIKITDRYAGFQVDLSKNYVKFKGSEEKTNSQNFHSKLFLFQENEHYYSKILIDSMPNIELQDEKVIAYLDSIENVIGSEIGDDIISGNEDANYLNGVGGVDLLYGRAGNDTLVLHEGYAEGGEGNDNYIILRSAPPYEYNKIVETIINDQGLTESSVVKLNYSFNEIVSINRREKNVVINLKIEDDEAEGSYISHSVTLKNFYNHIKDKNISHHYTLTTRDGFILTADEERKSKKIYQFSYLEKYNEIDSGVDRIYINENSQSMILSFDKVNKKSKGYNQTIRIIPTLKYSGFSSGNKVTFGIHGDSKNNQYSGVTANSFVRLSQGSDQYQLKTFLSENKHQRISISLSNYIDSLTPENVSHFFLSDVSGFNLVFDGELLSHRYLPDSYLKLKFNSNTLNKIVDVNKTIRFVDKDNIIFTLPKKGSHSKLLQPVVDLNLSISMGDDTLTIPRSLILNKEALVDYGINAFADSPTPLMAALLGKPKALIDLLPILELDDGDDIVVNYNNVSAVIDGGLGDDNIIVNDGHHILIAGEGDDRLSGGRGNDLLISQFGHDYLSGGEGSNVYVVQKRQGNVIVHDEGKNSHVFVTGLAQNEVLRSIKREKDTIYQTKDGLFTLIVKGVENNKELHEQAQKGGIAVTEKTTVLSYQGLANVIHDMAQFNQQQLTTMKGSDMRDASMWSPLTLIDKQL